MLFAAIVAIGVVAGMVAVVVDLALGGEQKSAKVAAHARNVVSVIVIECHPWKGCVGGAAVWNE